MSMRPSRVLRKLRAGDVALSFKINLSDARAVEIAAQTGYDAVWLCHEHVPNSIRDTESMIWAAKAYDCDTIVRVPRGSYTDYILPLEADAAGIMVPHCMNGDDARAIARMVRFQPIGMRACDGGNADGRYCTIPFTEYIEQANRERLVIVQIEDPEPLDHLDDIIGTDGIDMLLFGPGDFTHALGIPAQFDDPRVEDARVRVVEACKRAGKFAGTVGSPAMVPRYVEMGYQFINISADVIGITSIAASALAEARADLPPQTETKSTSPYK